MFAWNNNGLKNDDDDDDDDEKMELFKILLFNKIDLPIMLFVYLWL